MSLWLHLQKSTISCNLIFNVPTLSEHMYQRVSQPLYTSPTSDIINLSQKYKNVNSRSINQKGYT